MRDFCTSGWRILSDSGARLRNKHPVCELELSLPLCDYFLFARPTSLYADVLLPALLPEMRNKRVAIAWNFVSLREWPADSPGVCPRAGGTHCQMSAAFELDRIEESSALVQAEFIRQRPALRFMVDKLKNAQKPHAKNTDYAGQFFRKIADEPELHKSALVVLPKTMTLY